MSAVEPLCSLVEINSCQLSREESIILEAELFRYICESLKGLHREWHKDYFHLINFTQDEENLMLKTSFMRFIISDILSSDEYTLEGIARYTDTPEDIVQEIFTGLNTNPSAIFLLRIIELHRSVRPELYRELMNKIVTVIY